MRVHISPYAAKKYKRIVKKDKRLSLAIDKKLEVFTSNPHHPSLRLHKLTGKQIERWSISIKDNTRIIFRYVNEGVYIIDIGDHDEVY